MRQSPHRTMIDRGRKAGLGTLELYHAMSARQPEAAVRETDGNGYVSEIDRRGQVIFRPTDSSHRQ